MHINLINNFIFITEILRLQEENNKKKTKIKWVKKSTTALDEHFAG